MAFFAYGDDFEAEFGTFLPNFTLQTYFHDYSLPTLVAI